jgi:hypothetical protein
MFYYIEVHLLVHYIQRVSQNTQTQILSISLTTDLQSIMLDSTVAATGLIKLTVGLNVKKVVYY